MLETIIANGTTIPPIIIIQGRMHMENWYTEKLDDNVQVLLSDSGYINSELALIYLDHLIKHTDAGIDKPSKVLLMDRHGSHMDNDFIIKATANNIHPFPFPGHLTHVLQPLDVGVFQPYKHWHKKAVQHAMRNLDIDYNVASFLRDLGGIREDTFKKGTILGAFRKAGIWPIHCETAITKMKIYTPPDISEEPQLPAIPCTPKRYSQAEYGLHFWKEKLSKQLSSPSQQPFDSWVRGTRAMLAYGDLVTLQLDQLSTKVSNQQKAKSRNRHVLQKHGALTGASAKVRKAEKREKEEADSIKRKLFIERVARNKIKNELKARGVLARRQEKERKKRILELQKANQFIPIDMYEAIPDPEKLTTDGDIETQLREILVSTYGASFENTTTVLSNAQHEWEADYISFEGLDSQDWDREIDADNAIDPGLF
jgi:DDE superfamily endonuclease